MLDTLQSRIITLDELSSMLTECDSVVSLDGQAGVTHSINMFGQEKLVVPSPKDDLFYMISIKD